MPLDTPAAGAVLPHESYRVEWLSSAPWQPALRCPYCAESFAESRGLAVRVAGKATLGGFCPRCGSFRYRDLPDAASLDRQYAGAKTDFSEQLAHYVIPIGNALPATLDCLAGMQPREGRFESLLDVGCGFGFSLLASREGLGLRALGLEPSPSAVLGERHLGVTIDRSYLADFRARHPEPFDLVSANGVVEHVGDPEAFVGQLWAASRLAVSFLVPAAEGLAPDTPRPRLYGCLSPGAHLTMMSEAGARILAGRLGVPEVHVLRTGELMIVWYSRVPLMATPPERLADAAVDTALACLQSQDELCWQGGLNRLCMLSGAPRCAGLRAMTLALADDFLDRRAPGLRQNRPVDWRQVPDIAYSLLFMSAAAALGRGARDEALDRLRAARAHIRHLKATWPMRAIHALNIEGPIDGTIGKLEAQSRA
jgi:SAM-dependent methyltransferase